MVAAALRVLLESLPACARCERVPAVLFDANRWPLCGPCWETIPSAALPVFHDMRVAIAAATAALAGAA